VPAYESLLSRDPGHPEGVRALSGILLRQGARHRAEEVVRQALAARPGEADFQRLLAEIRASPQERGAGTPRGPGTPRTP
jgi:predicted Zn-dependent protease